MSVVVYLRSVVALAVVWHVASLWTANQVLLPSPLAVAESLGRLLWSGEVAEHTLISVRRLGLSFALAGLVGIPLGFFMGLSRRAEDLIDPVVELLRPISGIAWIPLALFIFGIGERLPVFIMFYSAVFPFVLSTVAAVRATDAKLVAAARTMGVSRATIVRTVVLPSALPGLLVGMRLAVGAAWMAMVAAELIGAPTGLGFAVEWYRELLMTPKVMAFVIVIGLLGYLADRAVRALQRRLTPWAIGLRVET